MCALARNLGKSPVGTQLLGGIASLLLRVTSRRSQTAGHALGHDLLESRAETRGVNRLHNRCAIGRTERGCVRDHAPYALAHAAHRRLQLRGGRIHGHLAVEDVRAAPDLADPHCPAGAKGGVGDEREAPMGK